MSFIALSLHEPLPILSNQLDNDGHDYMMVASEEACYTGPCMHCLPVLY